MLLRDGCGVTCACWDRQTSFTEELAAVEARIPEAPAHQSPLQRNVHAVVTGQVAAVDAAMRIVKAAWAKVKQ